jgi:cyclopropane-fatty-acyl-phospholipid synthase
MSTRAEIAQSYDVANEFFRFWLDREMNYSCALFEEGDDLESAQRRKLAWIADAAGVVPGCRVLDVGCGWGANLEFLMRERGCSRAVGITLSKRQYEAVRDRRIPRCDVQLVSYHDYRPDEPFDAVTCIGMIEHISTLEETRRGLHLQRYREFFRLLRGWAAPGAQLGLQSVLVARLPRVAADARELAWATRMIFPGAAAPRLEAIVASVLPHWEIASVVTRRDHYRQTCTEWLRRLCARSHEIRDGFGDAVFETYRRYLSAAADGFEKGYLSLAQLSLRRIDS